MLSFLFFIFFFVICSLTKANWLIDLTGDKLDDDRLIHWLNTIQYICCSRWLAGCWIIRLVRFHLLGWLTNWLSDWLSNWMSDKLKASLTDRPTDKLKDSWLTTDWFFASLSHVRFIYLNLVGSLFIFSLELQLEKELELSAMESQTQRWQQWRTTPLFVQQIRILILIPELDIMFKTSIEIDAIIQPFYPQDCRLHSPFFLL